MLKWCQKRETCSLHTILSLQINAQIGASNLIDPEIGEVGVKGKGVCTHPLPLNFRKIGTNLMKHRKKIRRKVKENLLYKTCMIFKFMHVFKAYNKYIYVMYIYLAIF